MTTKQKLRLIKLESEMRKITGCKNLLGDTGRALKAGVYADIIARHPGALSSGRFGRVVRAVNNLVAV